MKLDQDDSELILSAVRTLVPDGLRMYRRGNSNRLIVKYKRSANESSTLSTPAFGHSSARNSPAAALTIGYHQTLRAVTDFLRGVDVRWPGFVPGPVEVNAWIDGDVVRAQLTDPEGHTIVCPTLEHRGATPPRNENAATDIGRLSSFAVWLDNATLPAETADRIVQSVVAAMPPDFTVRQGQRGVILRTGGMVLNSDRVVRPSSRLQPFAPRNCDGVSQRSVGWATWLLLDGLVEMSRSRGAPIDQATAMRLQAYTQVIDGHLHCWLAEPGVTDPTVTFPTVDLTDLRSRPPSGPRLPIHLSRRNRLPALGQVMTAPPDR